MIIAKKITINRAFLRIRCFFGHYETLGLERRATQQEIKTKYYELAKKYHPDMTGNEANSQQFVKIQEAYEILGDQQKRRQYDSSFYSNQQQAWSNNNGYQYQRKYHQHTTDHHNYYSNFAYETRPSFMSLVKNNIFTIILWVAFAYMFAQIVVFLERKMTEADIQRENWLMMADARKIQQRKKLYAQEIKEKNIYGQIVNLNCKSPMIKSTKTAVQEKQSLHSLVGIQKDRGDRSRQVMLMSEEEYI